MSDAGIVLGAMNYGTTVDEERAVALLDGFVERGGVWIDTADCYYEREGLIGPIDRVAFLRQRRAELQERLQQTQAALRVLDDKITYYSRGEEP